MHSKKLAVIAILVALILGTNYAMLPLNNVKLMDVIVFVGGFCFGPLVGCLIGIVSWAIYGVVNPGGFVLPIWLSTMLAEAIYGIAGGLGRRAMTAKSAALSQDRLAVCVFFGTVGVLLTLVYDLVTNVVFGYVYGVNILVAVLIGFVPFGFSHMISNAVFFGFGCVPSINAILKTLGGEIDGISAE